ncbi:uncharacterized protein LOC127504171 isoform X1 [Ctenopharyngodon idella]|uniref:uncharacterized protein LOC127504171 isoform X1 n=1 Tax=Ctenopharyngodon idella TaxID=7959 RepID=UPI0022321BBA|nr:uncharacterized protein LOC127504171 isoform X1 [Ctenopharyngodon idella]
MKCSSRLLCGILMSCLCFRVTGLSSELTVNQSQSSITVYEGDSAQITCCWNKIGYSVKVAWYIKDTKLSGVNEQRQEHQTQNCSTLHLTNILKNYTGHYVCEVTQDIPVLFKLNSTGTALSVIVRQLEKITTVSYSPHITQTKDGTSTASPSSPANLTLHLSLAAAIGLVTVCLALSVCKMRNSCKKTERVVIHQTPHSEGEEHEHMEEEDGSTGSSRGSLQWYQVPVYWSYFDLQRGEEDK